MNKTIVCLLIFPLLFSNAFGGKKNVTCRFENVRFEKGNLLFDFYTDNIVNKKLLTGLRKGLTATLEYKIQLWKRNRYWPDSIVKERFRRIKISYDTWQKSYIVTEHYDEQKSYTSDEVLVNCSALENFKIAGAELMQPGREYRIIVRVLLKKISLENYEEIKKWLEGRAEEIDIRNIKSAKSGEKVTNWFLNFLFNITGFGDEIIVSKSKWVRIPESYKNGQNP